MSKLCDHIEEVDVWYVMLPALKMRKLVLIILAAALANLTSRRPPGAASPSASCS
jgi:hypothetical protein